MVESSDVDEVSESFFVIIWSLVPRWIRICMDESSDASEVSESVFIIIWSLVLR